MAELLRLINFVYNKLEKKKQKNNNLEMLSYNGKYIEMWFKKMKVS